MRDRELGEWIGALRGGMERGRAHTQREEREV
jgi:hypothetical protein